MITKSEAQCPLPVGQLHKQLQIRRKHGAKHGWVLPGNVDDRVLSIIIGFQGNESSRVLKVWRDFEVSMVLIRTVVSIAPRADDKHSLGFIKRVGNSSPCQYMEKCSVRLLGGQTHSKTECLGQIAVVHP